MHALDWIAEHGRFLRLMNAGHLRKILERQKGQCTWCSAMVPRGRLKWCSVECVRAFNERCWPHFIRRAIQRRDKGVCAKCGEKHPWEADHIIPVIEGGGLCDLSGYRTLCRRCHNKESAALAARRAKSNQKREDQPLLFSVAV